MRASDGFGLLRRWNWFVTLAMLALVAVGVLFVYSACHMRTEPAVRLLYRRQMAWGAAGFAAYVLAALIDYRRLRDGSWFFYGMTLVLLVLVLMMGQTIYGARRWLMFFGVGVQPSEFAKLAVILAIAHYLSRPTVHLGSWRTVFAVLAIVGVPMLFILRQPDLGTALVCVTIAVAMMFAGGVSLRRLGVLVAVGMLLAVHLLGALFVPRWLGMEKERQDQVFAKLTGLSDYQRRRLEVFFDPDMDPRGAGWNRRQSELAVGSGRWSGRGYLQGTQNILGYLPRTVAPTDFIFSVIAEEVGFLGASAVLGLFAVVVIGGMRAAWRARDRMGRLICVGAVTMIVSHVFINVAMTIGLMPITGLPLPLVSYGGSFVLCAMAALGAVQSVYVRRPATA